jgi:IclR helix-turn-helix domain
MWSSFLNGAERRRGEIVNSESSIESDRQPEDRPPRSSESQDSRGLSDEQTTPPARGRKASGESLVSITLSRNQVDHVTRAALGEDAGASVSALVAGTGFHRSYARQLLSARYRDLQDNRRLSRSLLAGLLVLSCFPSEGVDMGIKDISEQLELNTSTVHRYVLTLVAAGLLERDPETRRYRLLLA